MILYSISSVTNKQTNQQNLETPKSWPFFASQHGTYHYTWPCFFSTSYLPRAHCMQVEQLLHLVEADLG